MRLSPQLCGYIFLPPTLFKPRTSFFGVFLEGKAKKYKLVCFSYCRRGRIFVIYSVRWKVNSFYKKNKIRCWPTNVYSDTRSHSWQICYRENSFRWAQIRCLFIHYHQNVAVSFPSYFTRTCFLYVLKTNWFSIKY